MCPKKNNKLKSKSKSKFKLKNQSKCELKENTELSSVNESIYYSNQSFIRPLNNENSYANYPKSLSKNIINYFNENKLEYNPYIYQQKRLRVFVSLSEGKPIVQQNKKRLNIFQYLSKFGTHFTISHSTISNTFCHKFGRSIWAFIFPNIKCLFIIFI